MVYDSIDCCCQLLYRQGMTLDDFRRQQKLTYRQLAELLGASHATVARRWCLDIDNKDRMIPAPNFMERIVNVTDGAVTPNDFYLRRMT